MHHLITDDPDWAVLQKDRKRITTSAEIHNRQVAAEQATYKRDLAEYVVAKEAALLAGDDPPPTPKEPSLDPADARIFITQLEQCTARERQWLGMTADRHERRLHDRETELLGRSADAVQELRQITGEMNDLCATAAKVRAASEDRSPVHRRAVQASDLVAAVEGGRRFLSRLLREGDTHHGGQRSQTEDVATFERSAPFRPHHVEVRHTLQGRR